MPNLYLLDTDIASYRLRRYSETLTRRLRHTPSSQICISAVTAAELLVGRKRFALSHPDAINIDRLLAAADIRDWTFAAAEAYADIRHSLTLTGQLIGELDMMIAAHALALDATLVTNNTRHYARIAPPLRVENWTEA